MRPMENAAAALATGEFLMKLDAHCIMAPGWDEALKAHCEPGDLLVPTRHSIDEPLERGARLQLQLSDVAVRAEHVRLRAAREDVPARTEPEPSDQRPARRTTSTTS
jgi:hypothetical protein